MLVKEEGEKFGFWPLFSLDNLSTEIRCIIRQKLVMTGKKLECLDFFDFFFENLQNIK